jgi:argininosuccinate lyase
MWQPDNPIETLSVVVSGLVNLDRLAEDLQIFATAEFDLVELSDGYSRASVIMPQKKNPYALAYIRGATNELIGMQTSAATLGRTPSGQVDNRIFMYGDVPRALEMATGVATLMGGVLEGMSFHPAIAAARLSNGFTTATDLAETITLETGIDFRTAHHIVGRLVREASQANRTMRELTTADLDAAAQAILNRPLHISETTFAHATDPATAIVARRGIGGAAPEPLSEMLLECRNTLDACTSWYNTTTAKITAAEDALIQIAQQICGGA